MTYTCVTPWIYPPFMQACAATCKFDDASWLRIDNTGFNWGVDRAVNYGIDKMINDDTDWLIYMSSTMRFGEPGGLDFIEHLERNPGHKVIEAMGYNTQSIWGWHLIAFSREAMQTVGRWDENFSPGYFEDLDYSLRFQRVYNIDGRVDPVWEKMQIEAEDAGSAHALQKAGVKINVNVGVSYFEAKWGRHPSSTEPEYQYPWNNPENPVQYWPPVTLNGVTGYWNQPLPPLGEL